MASWLVVTISFAFSVDWIVSVVDSGDSGGSGFDVIRPGPEIDGNLSQYSFCYRNHKIHIGAHSSRGFFIHSSSTHTNTPITVVLASLNFSLKWGLGQGHCKILKYKYFFTSLVQVQILFSKKKILQ